MLTITSVLRRGFQIFMLMMLTICMTAQVANAQDYRSTMVRSMAWSPDGKLLAVGGYGTISIIQSDTMELLYKLHAREAEISSVTWSPDGKYLLSNDIGDNAFIWDVKTGDIKGYISANSHGQTPAISKSEWNFDGSLIADHYDFGSMMTIRDGKNGQLKKSAYDTYSQLSISFLDFAWSDTANQIAISTFDNQIVIVDADDWHILNTITVPYPVRIEMWKDHYLYTSKDYNPNVAALNGNHTLYHNILQVWDIDIRQAISTFDVGSLDSVNGRLWSPDGSKVVVRRSGGIFQIWNAKTGKIVQSQEFEHGVQYYIWNPTSDSLVLAYSPKDLRTVKLPLNGKRLAPLPPTSITYYTQLHNTYQYNFIVTRLNEAPFDTQSDDDVGYYFAEGDTSVYRFFAPYTQWSPDAQRFLYPKALDNSHYELFEKVIVGGNESQLTHDGGINLFPVYSPAEFADDTSIAYLHSDDSKIFSLIELGQDRQTHTTLVNDQTLYMERPAWLPKLGEKQIAVSMLNEHQDYDIYLVSEDQSQPLPLVESPANDHYPSWSPDAKQMAFVSDRDGDEAIFILDLATGTIHKLTGGTEPEWSPDGSLIAFRRAPSLYVIDLQSGQETMLIKTGWTARWIPS